MDSFKVVLEGPAPWGFRLQGGKDFNVPLSISRLTPGGKAAQAGVAVGDWVLNIDGENAGSLTHIEAQNKIRACGERLSLGLSRAQPVQSKPQKALTPPADPPRYTFAPSASLNKTARPFGAPPPTDSTLRQNGYVSPCPSTPTSAHCLVLSQAHTQAACYRSVCAGPQPLNRVAATPGGRVGLLLFHRLCPAEQPGVSLCCGPAESHKLVATSPPSPPL
ncbi:PDZ and LIM domain 7, isoform CRA_g [Mus musculus]|uniref:PDZ and LIM domain 7 n=1 Tax=Mus musculus TaxID=10090 RepID=B8JJB3_MOUSE|nr:PDZ and LIM domain 7, isoform CRA_g [Mus musculus]